MAGAKSYGGVSVKHFPDYRRVFHGPACGFSQGKSTQSFQVALDTDPENTLKLLVSAYACEPGKGSEPAVGWNWVRALARRGYRLHVITRSNNRDAIESAAASLGQSVTFHYYDLPAWARAWKRRRGAIYLYYLFWQIGAFRLARRLHACERFHLVHHVTFASFRQPSFMGALGIPFIFGPVGGGETMPPQLRKGLSLRGRLAEALRNAGNALVAFDPLMRFTFSRAGIIACTTAETVARIPRPYRSKCRVQLAIGIDESEILPLPPEPFLERNPTSRAAAEKVQGGFFPRESRSKRSGSGYIDPDFALAPRFLFVGRLLYWKGLHLAFRALSLVRPSVPNVRLRVIGAGEDRSWLEQQARAAGVADLLEWVRSAPHHRMANEYHESLALVFPSLHDSGGMVVLEALAAGLPVVCLDLGGPAVIATDDCAVVVSARRGGEREVVSRLAEAMIRLAADPALRVRLSENAIDRARQLTWDRAAGHLYAALEL